MWWRQSVEVEVRVALANFLRISRLDLGNRLGWKVAFDGVGIKIGCRGTVLRRQLSVEPARVAIDLEQTQRRLIFLSTLLGVMDGELLHGRIEGLLSELDYHGRLLFFFLDSHAWQEAGSLVANVIASFTMRARVKIRFDDGCVVFRHVWMVAFGVPFREPLRVQTVIKLVRGAL